jgi:hypothetical protein
MNPKYVPVVLAVLLISSCAWGQSSAAAEPRAVPILTGYTGMVNTFTPGARDLGPSINPIVLVPFGQNWLIETEGEFAANYHNEDGVWEKEYEKNLEYLQLDYTANKYVTVVAGRYLVPFGIFVERLHPMWIKNLQNTPLVFGLAPEAGNGGMLRGGFQVGKGVNLTYAGYFSATTTNPHMDATRVAGTRIALFFPGQRLEVGTSFQRILQDVHSNNVGLDFTWQARQVPLEFRGEYAHTAESGSGYWVESAYRFRRSRNSFLRKTQAVVRMEQFFAPPGDMAAGGATEGMAGMGGVPTMPAPNGSWRAGTTTSTTG